MSSMRNAVQRRNHKERAQPLERQRWGILEKRKDYKLRAADHKSKLARLKILNQKAQDRNPDEFSFAMLNSKVDSQGQRIADRGNKPLSVDVVKLLKTQDVGYLRMQLQIVRKERRRLEEEIMLEDRGAVKAVKDGEGEGQKGRHTVFVGKKEEQRSFKPEDWFGTREDGVEKAKKSSKKQQEAEKLRWKEEMNMRKKRERIREGKISHLESVKARERDLMIAEEELEKQRAKMNGTTGGVNKNGIKYKIRERKR